MIKVTCYGGGLIGASWATNFALEGCQVLVYDLDEPRLDKAKGQLERNLAHLSQLGCLAPQQAAAVARRVVFTNDPARALTDTEFVQESGPEDLALKRTIMQTIERYAPGDCPVASSTSGMRISDIAKDTQVPERFVGAHPFNPPHLIPLVEITRSEQTSTDCLNRVLAFYRSMKKEPIVLQKEKIGFVANRLSHAVLREVMSLIAEGVCTPEDADRALVYGPGLRWASIGQIVIGELGSQGGNREGAVRFKALNEAIFRDLENRVALPEHWGEIAAQGAEDAIAHMPDAIGHTREAVAQFRDRVLVELLRLHGKLPETKG